MANEDTFIQEVTEEVRRDRLFALFRKYGWIAVLLVLLVVGGASWNEWRKAQARAQAEAKGDALISALQADGADAQLEALNAVEGSENPSAKAIHKLLQSAAALEADNPEAAAAALDEIAENAAIPQVYRDVAVIKRVLTAGDTMSPEDRKALLAPLAKPGNPFRLLAIEQRAFAEVEMGETDVAIETLQGILADAEVTEDLRRRAQQLIVALGGSLEPT